MIDLKQRVNIREALKLKKAVIGGWVKDYRDLGGLKFLRIRDWSGEIQSTIVKKNAPKQVIEELKKITKESVLLIKGRVQKNEKVINKKEIIPEQIRVLSIAEQPVPLNLSEKVVSGLDARLEWRELDLRRPRVTAIFKIQDKVMQVFQEHFRNKGFVQIQPPSIIAASSEGGADLYALKYFEQKAFLAQSPQLYKQMAVMGGLEKVFMITPVWRAEKHNTTRHLNESRQCDIEVGFTDDAGAIKHMIDFMKDLTKRINEECKEELGTLNVEVKKIKRIPVITYDQAVQELKSLGERITWGDDFTPEHEKKLSAAHDNIVFIKDYPTRVRAFYSMPHEQDSSKCKAYDLLFNGCEVLSGAQRIHDPALLIQQLNVKGLRVKDFEFYVNAFRYGAPPHAGWSFGLERLTMSLLKLPNIREACLFPRDRTRITP